MEIASFIDDLIRSVEKDSWEPTDTGYQLATRTFMVKVRKIDGSNIELAVEDYNGREITKAFQKPGPGGAEDDITLKLSFLFQKLETKSIDRIAALDDVIRELRIDRGGT